MSTQRLKIVRPTVSDEALVDLALELARKEEEDLQRLCDAVLTHDYETAEKLAKELKSNAAN